MYKNKFLYISGRDIYVPKMNRLHVSWGTTSFQVKATFRQQCALVVETIDVNPEDELVADDYLSAFCYLVDHMKEVQTESGVLEKVGENDIFCYNGHGTDLGNLVLDINCGSDECIITPSEVEAFIGNKFYKFVYLNCCDAGLFLNEWMGAFQTECALGFFEKITWELGRTFAITFGILLLQKM